MVDKKFLAVAVSAIFVLGMYGPNVAEIIQSAEAHGVQAQLQSRFIQIKMRQLLDNHYLPAKLLFFLEH